MIRQIEVDDVDRLERLFYRLSPETVYRRFFSPINKPRRSTLEHLSLVDHWDRDAIVAVVGGEVIGVARYDRSHDDASSAEIAVVVEDAWQRHHVATLLTNELARRAARRGVTHFTASMLSENRPVVSFMKSLNPKSKVKWDGGNLAADMPLRAAV